MDQGVELHLLVYTNPDDHVAKSNNTNLQLTLVRQASSRATFNTCLSLLKRLPV